MSTTIDERVVEMRFDNKQFENNVQTSLSTLDKLKKALKLDGAAKGLEEVNTAASKCNLNPIATGVETVKVKFSALEVMAITALQNITNSAINAGKKITNALTIEPVTTGFQEYETQINAIQTIMSNTRSAGTTLDQVNSALDELNHYADMTIYNFTEMTRNIGTFTAAGVDLDTSVSAIKGIANLAAVSGSTSQQASTAMYQLSQALAAGTVKLQDWNSVVNAGMGGQVFQDALKETARVHGIAIDQMIKDEGSFRETLSKGWLSSEILTETLSKFTGDLTEAQIISMGYTKEQAADIIAMGKDANDAATKVKTFSQLFDTLKEAAQSGWTQSWELIVGDFEKAKERLTSLSDTFSGIINDAANARNAVLSGALSTSFEQLTEKLQNAGIESSKFQDKITELAKTHNVDLESMIEKEGSFEKALKKAFQDGTLDKSILKDAIKSLVGNISEATNATEDAATQMEKYGDIVNKVIRGDFGNGEARVKALTAAGYDYATIQNLVNEKLGSSYRLTSTLTEAQIKQADSLANLSDEQLKTNGYTEEQIEALRELQKEANESGTSIDKLIDAFEKPSGAELAWDSLFNIIDGVTAALQVFKGAWNEVFHPGMSSDEIARQKADILYGILEAINKLTLPLKKFKENLADTGANSTVDKLSRTFKGLFAVIQLVTTILGGGFKLALKVISTVLGAFDMSILDVTASIGDLIVRFSDFVLKNENITKVVTKTVEILVKAYKKIKEWIGAFLELPQVQSAIATFRTTFQNAYSAVSEYLSGGIQQIKDFIARVEDMDGISLESIKAIFSDFKENVVGYFFNIEGSFGSLSEKITEFKNNIVSKFEEAGGSIDAFKRKVSDLWATVKSKFSENVNIGNLLGIGVGVGSIVGLKKIGDALSTLADPFNNVNDILKNAGTALEAWANKLNASATKVKTQSLLNIAIAIGILAASLFVLSRIPTEKLDSVMATLLKLCGVLLGLAAVMKVLNLVKGSGGASTLLALAASLMILVGCLKSMEDLDDKTLNRDLVKLGEMALGLVIVAGLLSFIAPQLSKGGLALLAIAGSLKIILSVLIDIDNLKLTDISGDMKILAVIIGSLLAISLIMKKIKLTSVVGILAIAVALKVLISAIDDIGELNADKIKGNIGILVGIMAAFIILMAASKLAGQNAAKAGVGILAMSASLILIAGAMKILATMDSRELGRATLAVTALILVFSVVIMATKLAGENAKKAGAMLLMMSSALLIIAGAMAILSMLDADGLTQAMICISGLMVIFAGIIAVSKLAGDAKSTMLMIAITIGVLAASLSALAIINPDGLTAATVALGVVMGVFALVVVSTKLVGDAKSTLIILSAVVLILSGCLYVLGQLPVENSLAAAASLSILLISFSASLLILSEVKTLSVGAMAAIAVMVLVVGALALVLAGLSQLDMSGSLEVALSLSVLLVSLSASCILLGYAGTVAGTAMAGIGVLVTLVGAMGGLMIGLGALATQCDGMEGFLNKGIPILIQIGTGIGQFIGGFVGGIASGIMSALPSIGQSLADFGTKVKPFIDNMKNVDESVVSGISLLAGAILTLTAADILDGLTSWLTGGSSLSDFGEQLVPFGKKIAEFSDAVANVNGDNINAAATAGKTLAEMADALPNSGGLLGAIFGNNDMDDFGTQLETFGLALVRFSTSVTLVNTDNVNKGAAAGKTVAEMADALPNSGGVAGFFAGNNDMDTFGGQLVAFGLSLAAFSTVVALVNKERVENAAAAGKTLAEMAEAIPNSGGLISVFTGNNDMDTFGGQLVLFGGALASFSIISALVVKENVDKAVEAGTALVELASSVPSMGGLVDFLTGSNDIALFGEQLAVFGLALADFSNVTASINEENIDKAVTAGTSLVELANSIPEMGGLLQFFTGGNDIATFGAQLVSFGTNISMFYGSVSGIDTTQFGMVITEVKSLVNVAKSMTDLDTSGMSGFGAALTKLGNNGISGFIAAFEGATDRVNIAGQNMIAAFVNGAKTKQASLTTIFKAIIQACITAINTKRSAFESAGKAAMTSFIGGVRSKSSAVVSAFTGNLNSAVQGVRGRYDDFYQAGKYLVDGFCEGINANTYKAEARSKAMAAKAAEAAAKELDEHSPSKVGYRIGDYFGQGFVNGISEYADKAYDTSATMADSAKTGLSDVISRVKDAIDTNIDTQPTIRPVLDLSDVEAQSLRLGALLSTNQAVSIGTSMRLAQESKIQNESLGASSANNNFTFTQNNYSPKALSRTEIYRQTKNQFSAMERMVTM